MDKEKEAVSLLFVYVCMCVWGCSCLREEVLLVSG